MRPGETPFRAAAPFMAHQSTPIVESAAMNGSEGSAAYLEEGES